MYCGAPFWSQDYHSAHVVLRLYFVAGEGAGCQEQVVFLLLPWPLWVSLTPVGKCSGVQAAPLVALVYVFKALPCFVTSQEEAHS